MRVKRLDFMVQISLAVALLLIVAVVGFGCGESDGAKEDTNEEQADTGLSGELTISGSTTVLPIAQEAADQFMEENPDVRITVHHWTGPHSDWRSQARPCGLVEARRDIRNART